MLINIKCSRLLSLNITPRAHGHTGPALNVLINLTFVTRHSSQVFPSLNCTVFFPIVTNCHSAHDDSLWVLFGILICAWYAKIIKESKQHRLSHHGVWVSSRKRQLESLVFQDGLAHLRVSIHKYRLHLRAQVQPKKNGSRSIWNDRYRRPTNQKASMYLHSANQSLLCVTYRYGGLMVPRGKKWVLLSVQLSLFIVRSQAILLH